MRRSFLLIVLLAAMAIARHGLAGEWHVVGLPEGGFLGALKVPDPYGQRAYAVANAMVYRSDDRGRNWTVLPAPRPPSGSYTVHLAVTQADPDVLVVVLVDAAHRSIDGGLTWSPLPVEFGPEAGTDPLHFTAAAIDPQNANRIAVFRSHWFEDYYLQLPYLWQTNDGTSTAIAQRVPLPDPRCPIRVHTHTERVLAAEFIQGQLHYLHLYHCTPLPYGSPGSQAIRLHAWGGNLSVAFGLYWPSGAVDGNILYEPPYILARGMRRVLQIDPSSGHSVIRRDTSDGLHALGDGSVVSTEGGVFRSTDAGTTWSPLTSQSLGVNGFQASGYLNAAGFRAPTRWLVNNADGVFASEDAGGHWELSSGQLSSHRVSALAVDPANPSRVWFGLGGGQWMRHTGRVLYRSLAGDPLWSNSDLPGKAFFLRALALDTGTVAIPGQTVLYATGVGCTEGLVSCPPTMSVGHGIYKSYDAGITWSHLGAPLPRPTSVLDGLRGIAVDVASGNPQTRTVLVAYRHRESLVIRSHDSGATWTDHVDGLPAYGDNNSFSTTEAVVFAPSQSGRAYLATRVTPFGNHPVDVQAGGVFRSDDGGRSWSHRSNGLPAHPGTLDVAGVAALAVDPDDADTVWALSSSSVAGSGDPVNRLFRTIDGGSAWAARGDGLPTGGLRAIAIAPDEPGVLCVGGTSGVYCSQDDGSSWQPLPRQPRWQVLNLAMAGPYIYAGTGGGGVLRILRPGAGDEGVLRRLRGRFGTAVDGGAMQPMAAGRDR